MAAFNYVTLVAFGGTPCRLADQTGAPLPTTGTGALVFANNAVLTNPIITNMTFSGGLTLGPVPQTGASGTAAAPILNFTNALTSGFYSTGVNVGVAVNGVGVALFVNTGLQVQNIAVTGAITSGNWNGNPISAGFGGTGQSVYVIGDILFANSTATLARLPAAGAALVLTSNGVGVAPSWQAVSGSAGVVTIGFGTTGLTPSAATAGVVTVAGTLVAVNGGTGINTYVIGDILIANSTTTLTRLAAAGAGLVLTSNGAGAAPSWQSAGGGTVASVSFGTTGLLPNSPTTGAIVVTGTLAVANGGTGVTTNTGTGANVQANTPALITPVLGVASCTSLNGITFTTSTGTVTLTNLKTLTVTNTLTFSGTDSSTLNIGGGGTLGTAAFQNTGTSGANVPLLSTANIWSLGQTFSSALTYGGVTLSNAVTGTGNMVLATSPTLTTPALGVATASSIAINGATIGANVLAVSGAVLLSNQTTLVQITETFTAPTISGGTLTINVANGTVFNVSNNANITTFTISGTPASLVSSFTIVFTANGTGFTQAWGASVKWPSGNAPTLTTTNTKKDIVMFFTNDGGTTWYGFVSGQNF